MNDDCDAVAIEGLPNEVGEVALDEYHNDASTCPNVFYFDRSDVLTYGRTLEDG